MQINRALLQRYSAGRCNEEEKKRVEAWLEDGEWPLPEDAERLPPELKNKLWERIYSGIKAAAPSTLIRKHGLKWLGMAAALLVVAATVVLAYFIRRAGVETGQPRVYATGPGEQKRIMLSDSSVVFLNPGSVLEVMQPFPADRRELILKGGAAFFEVARDEQRPFTVISGAVHTTALGTSFKVVNRARQDKIDVLLSYGRVRVEDYSVAKGKKGFLLDPGEEITYDKNSGNMRKKIAAPQRFDYRHNVLYFKDAGIGEVVEKLGRYYHVDVRYETLKQVRWSVSGEFAGQPLDIVMKAIAYSCNISYSIKGDSLILTR
ncbi:FecR family protein [Compostibacter hankyongensis]|uniref:FecR family protein n=1 Tax=Compostibacter hankyongensis TaxID=1007089 RepID=A0ABP8FJQ9_9BACT